METFRTVFVEEFTKWSHGTSENQNYVYIALLMSINIIVYTIPVGPVILCCIVHLHTNIFTLLYFYFAALHHGIRSVAKVVSAGLSPFYIT